MRDYSSAVFLDAAGQQYQLLMSFTPSHGSTVMLDSKSVMQFDYQTSLNDLVVRGSVVYMDAGGMMDASLHEPGGILEVVFSRMETERDAGVEIVSELEGGTLSADFLVETAGILKREDDVITYKMQFTSLHIVDCLKTVDFSNYGKDPEPVLDILRQVAAGSGLAVDEDTFGAVKHQPRMNYITNGNDNLFTSAKFLLDKLYYASPRASSMVFVFWNELRKRLQLFDVAGRSSVTGQTAITLSMFNTQSESMSGGVQNELGTVTKFPTSAVLGLGYRRQIASYSYDANRFDYDNVKPEQVYHYMNERFGDGDVLEKYRNRYLKEQNSYVVRGSFWNNDFHFYGTCMDVFLNNNALLVKTVGNITRLPGSVVGITVDRGQSDAMQEDPSLYEDVLRRYRGLDGAWIAAKVHHYVQPNAESKADRYRQTLTLVRNFSYPDADGQSK